MARHSSHEKSSMGQSYHFTQLSISKSLSNRFTVGSAAQLSRMTLKSTGSAVFNKISKRPPNLIERTTFMTCQWICTSLRNGLLHPRCLILVAFLACLVWPTAMTTPAQESSKPESSQTASTTAYVPATANHAASKWFQDAKFGMFIHWGVYSVLGEGEWVMNEKRIPVSEYEKIPPQFNPTEFNPGEWVALAKAAGMKYITITSKHHDGFAMFDSKVSDYDIVDRTPYKKDVLKMLADECRKQGV